MDLKTFITQALLDIVGAVKEAQSKSDEGAVVPGGINKTFQAVEKGVSELQAIDFEVTVRAEEKAGSEVRLSVVAAIVGGDVKGASGKQDAHASTLRFRIPVKFPTSGKL